MSLAGFFNLFINYSNCHNLFLLPEWIDMSSDKVLSKLNLHEGWQTFFYPLATQHKSMQVGILIYFLWFVAYVNKAAFQFFQLASSYDNSLLST